MRSQHVPLSRNRLRVPLLAAFALAATCTALAQQQAPTVPTPPNTRQAAPAPAPPANPPTTHSLDKADLEAFFDGIIPLQLQRSDLSGAVVLVKRGDEVLLAKGYGYADTKKKTPVDPGTSMFRLASISKLFTWVSVMQLVEQGKLNLDTDVNQYLDFQIRPAFGKPITLRNLMTHTGGFEETIRDVIVIDPNQTPSLRAFLMHNQPRRIYPPGTISAYSNYGVGLAGYIVQRVSGESFPQYVSEHIFTPLGMTHSSFSQPLQKDLQSSVSEGYRSADKSPVGFEIFNPAPAGGISSSAADMGRFAAMLLNGGTLDGKQILKPETVAAMWTRQFAANDAMPAMCMGFYQVWRNRLHWIGHEGDLIAFHSAFFLEPEQKLTLFVSYNTVGRDDRGGSSTRPELMDAFADRYFPATITTHFQKVTDADRHDIPGTYQSTRRADSTKLALGNLLDQAHVNIDKDDELVTDRRKTLRGRQEKWKPLGNGVWQETDGGQDLVYPVRSSSGKAERIAVDFPGVQMQRVPWYEDGRLVLTLASLSAATMLLVWIAILLRLGRRILFRNRPALLAPEGTRRLTLAPRIAALAWLGAIAYLLALMSRFLSETVLPPGHSFDKWFVLQNLIVAAAIFFSLFAIVSAVRVWSKQTRAISKVKFSLVGLACTYLIWFSIHWNLIGPAHRY
jgi:CubicO group peptidase (beta-lactamase class C family)